MVYSPKRDLKGRVLKSFSFFSLILKLKISIIFVKSVLNVEKVISFTNHYIEIDPYRAEIGFLNRPQLYEYVQIILD